MRCGRIQSVIIVLCAAGFVGALGVALYNQILLIDEFHALWRLHDHAMPGPLQSASRLPAQRSQVMTMSADLRVLLAAFAGLLPLVIGLAMSLQRRQRLRDLVTSAGCGDWSKVMTARAESWWPEALVSLSVLPAPIAAWIVVHSARARSLELIRSVTGEPGDREVADLLAGLVSTQSNAIVSATTATTVICFVALASLALALSWRTRLGAILQAARAAMCEQQVGQQPYRSWQDNKEAIAWLRHPGPAPSRVAALVVAGWTAVLLPAAAGVIVFVMGPASCRDPKAYYVCEAERRLVGTHDLLAWFLASGAGLIALTVLVVIVISLSRNELGRPWIAPDIRRLIAPDSQNALPPSPTSAVLIPSALVVAALATTGLSIPACAQNLKHSEVYAPRPGPMDSAGFVLDSSLVSGNEGEILTSNPDARLLLSAQGVRWKGNNLTLELAAERVPRELYGSRLWLRCRADVPLGEVHRLLKELRKNELRARVHLTVVRMNTVWEPALGDVAVPWILWRRFDLGFRNPAHSSAEGQCGGADSRCDGYEGELDAMVERLRVDDHRDSNLGSLL
ncbi:MAG: hypothetical protein HY898_19410 [Deltaproteobacteria bacterium]|nr:hypothetical protein [Deltaproteobacteria bacterium]